MGSGWRAGGGGGVEGTKGGRQGSYLGILFIISVLRSDFMRILYLFRFFYGWYKLETCIFIFFAFFIYLICT